MDLIVLVVLVLCLAAALAAAVYASRQSPSEIWEWEEKSYQPRSNEPRAVTRIHSKNIDWEIRT